MEYVNQVVASIKAAPLETWVLIGLILLAQGFVLSGALEYLKRRYDWKERGSFYIHRVVLLASVIVGVGEYGLHWLNDSGLATTTLGTYAATVFMYFIGVKNLIRFYNYLLEQGMKNQAAYTPAPVNGTIFDEGVQS